MPAGPVRDGKRGGHPLAAPGILISMLSIPVPCLRNVNKHLAGFLSLIAGAQHLELPPPNCDDVWTGNTPPPWRTAREQWPCCPLLPAPSGCPYWCVLRHHPRMPPEPRSSFCCRPRGTMKWCICISPQGLTNVPGDRVSQFPVREDGRSGPKARRQGSDNARRAGIPGRSLRIIRAWGVGDRLDMVLAALPATTRKLGPPTDDSFGFIP